MRKSIKFNKLQNHELNADICSINKIPSCVVDEFLHLKNLTSISLLKEVLLVWVRNWLRNVDESFQWLQFVCVELRVSRGPQTAAVSKCKECGAAASPWILIARRYQYEFYYTCYIIWFFESASQVALTLNEIKL